VITADHAHRTQLTHTQSKARVALQIVKKQNVASQRLNNRLLSRQQRKKIKEKNLQIVGTVPINKHTVVVPIGQVQPNDTQPANLLVVETVPKNEQHTVVVPGVQKSDNDYQQERENAVKRILYLKLKKKDAVVQWFQHLAPKNESNVVNQNSLALVLQKLKVSNIVSERMAQEIIDTKGMNLTITLEQFWGWADA
jgi:hypothetical protein